MQDVSGGDNDDGNGDNDDGPGGDDLHGGSAKDRSKEIKERFGIDDAVGDVDSAVKGDVKDAKPTSNRGTQRGKGGNPNACWSRTGLP